MPRTPNVSVQNSFIKGLITEATALNSPENSCTETYNCIFNRNGLVERRHSFQLETNASVLELDLTGKAITTFLWKNVASQGDLRFVVLQLGHSVYFFRVTEGHPISEDLHSTVLNMSTYLAPDAPSEATNATEFNYSSGNGYLFITSPYHESIYVDYDEDTDAFTVNQITIKIRDTLGFEDDIWDEDERPNMDPDRLEDGHLYNLFNQGWTARTLYKWKEGIDQQDANQKRKDSPSNCDVDWLFKDETNRFQFSPDRIGDNTYRSPAPRGHYKHVLYDIDRSYESEENENHPNGIIHVSGRAERIQITDKRVAFTAFFAGRVFYSGLEAEGNNSKIFFSQIIEKPEQFGKCFQKNDPTAEKLFDLLPTDGGYIDIIEAGGIKKLFPMANALVAFCTNGIWAITGSQGIGFVANDYTVVKVSSIETPSATSFVDVEGTPYWWCESGIYTIVSQGNGGGFQVVNLTDDTIKTLFDEIPFQNKAFARGVFDPLSKTIQWVYKSTVANAINEKYTYDRVLNYNMLTKAFFPWSMQTSTVKVKGILDLSNFGSGSIQRNVVDSGNPVIDGTDTIISYSLDGSLAGSTIKYFVNYDTDSNTFAECNENNEGYRDWSRIDGEAATGDRNEAYFVTGYSLKGQAIRRWQPIYVSLFSKCEVDSVYDFRGRWNFSTSNSASRWSTMQRATNTAGNFEYVTNKFKVRGDGVACQFEVRSVDDNPFFLVGWASLDSATKWV
jgi:hypothetical protein